MLPQMSSEKLAETLAAHRAWCLGTEGGFLANFRSVHLAYAGLSCAYLPLARFDKACLIGAHLSGAQLCGASFCGAQLDNAHLERADLSTAALRHVSGTAAKLMGAFLQRADLSHSSFQCAHFEGAGLEVANLQGADLEGANLERANLEGADLEGADLQGASFRNANLTGADLRETNLAGTVLVGANLTNTCLDPNAPIPAVSDQETLTAGLEIEGEYVYGYRTRISQLVGATEYVPGQTYTAPVFSVSSTECHPGLYLASNEWLSRHGYTVDRVRVRCLRTDLHRAGDKWRCRRLEVLELGTGFWG